MVKIGIALSGGGAKGAAHIGVLAALKQADIYPSHITGTSAGSIVAGMAALNIPIEKMQEIALHPGNILDPDCLGMLRGVFQLLMGKEVTLSGIYKGNKLLRMFHELYGESRMKDACMPLGITAVNIQTGRIIGFVSPKSGVRDDEDWHFISNARIADAVRASIAVPVVFQPYQTNEMLLVDGGVRISLPVSMAHMLGARFVLGVDLSDSDRPKPDVDNIIEIAVQTINIQGLGLVRPEQEAANFLLRIPLPGRLLSVDDTAGYIKQGYESAMQAMPELKKAIARGF